MTSAHRVTVGLLIGLALATACQLAIADRSRVGDETDVIDAGDCEIEFSLRRTRTQGSPRADQPSTQFGCGIGWRTELALAYATQRGDPSRARSLELEGKTALVDRQGGVGWSLTYGIDAEKDQATPWRRSGHFVALEATYAIGQVWLLEAKLGAARDRRSRSDAVIWAVGVERALGEAVEVRFELNGNDRGRPTWGTGLRYEIWPDHALLSLSYGASTGPVRERQVGLALTFEF
jgi:hypothetical protein